MKLQRTADLEFRSTRRVFITHMVKGGIFAVSYTVLGPNFLYATIDPTPEQTAGPFYKPSAPFKEQLVEAGDSGTALAVSGEILNTDEKPLPNTRIEIWHTDNSGHYDREGFRYRAQLRSNDKGKYRFQTILPGNYGGRAKHIHYRITAPDHKPIFTQLYFETDPFFEGNPDRNFRKDPIIQYRELIRPVNSSSDQLSVFFRICLEKT
jgi:protocatechuate 3,4-dioxygenase beta subunit